MNIRVFRVAICFVAAFAVVSARADTILPASHDLDSYMFIGLNTSSERGLSITEDFSAGIAAANNSHFIFTMIKFGDLSGLKTKAAGGGDKFLRLSTDHFPGPATIGVSAIKADIDANDATGYPSPLFIGNQFAGKTNVDRLRWYMNNVKGDNAVYGGYAGGAPHVGVIQFPTPGTYQLDVTSAVDAWISGTRPNYGFGLWGASVQVGEERDSFDLASLEHPLASTIGPALIISGQSSTPMPGDATGDNIVDRGDIVALMANFGRTGTGLTYADGDFDSSGSVTLADLMILQSHLSPAGSPIAATAVPEPSGLALFFLGAIGLAVCIRHRRRIAAGSLALLASRNRACGPMTMTYSHV